MVDITFLLFLLTYVCLLFVVLCVVMVMYVRLYCVMYKSYVNVSAERIIECETCVISCGDVFFVV